MEEDTQNLPAPHTRQQRRQRAREAARKDLFRDNGLIDLEGSRGTKYTLARDVHRARSSGDLALPRRTRRERMMRAGRV